MPLHSVMYEYIRLSEITQSKCINKVMITWTETSQNQIDLTTLNQ